MEILLSIHIPSEMSLFCFTGNRWVFELWIWNFYNLFFLGRPSWIISKSFLKKRCNRNVSLLARLWLQSAMWLCLYCSCSCSPRGTVIWSWERAVRCGNGLWRSNNYPFPCVTRKEEEMTCWDISPVKKKKVSRERLDLGVTVWRGQRKKKARVSEVKRRRLAQIRQQKRPGPVIWLEVFWTCCA